MMELGRRAWRVAIAAFAFGLAGLAWHSWHETLPYITVMGYGLLGVSYVHLKGIVLVLTPQQRGQGR